MTTLNTSALVWIFAGITGFVLVILQLFRRDPRLEERVKAFRPIAGGSAHGAPAASGGGLENLGAIQLLAAMLLPRRESQRSQLQTMLVHAGYYAPSAIRIYVVVQFCLAAALFVCANWLCRFSRLSMIDQVLSTTFAACAAYLLPWMWLRRRKAARHRILNRTLPDFLDVVVMCLDAGMTLEAVVQRVTEEAGFAHPLVADELRRVQREIELGAPPDRAFQSFAERTDAEVVRSLATVCHQARKFGSKMSDSLRAHADILRDQREQNAEEAAQKASVKILFPTLLCLFPAIFVVLAGPAAIQIADNFSGQEAQEQAVQSAPQ